MAHTWTDPMPDAVPLTSDELVIFPWNEQVLIDGRWVEHPEVASAIRAQRRVSSSQ